MEIKWDDVDPSNGKRRFVKAEHFAGRWQIYCRPQRRGIWEKWATPSREMWESLLDALERRLHRREGVEESDVQAVRKIILNWREAPNVD